MPSNGFPPLVFAGKVRRGQVVPENDALVQVIKLRPEILQQMLSTVLNIIMFEDCRNQVTLPMEAQEFTFHKKALV